MTQPTQPQPEQNRWVPAPPPPQPKRPWFTKPLAIVGFVLLGLLLLGSCLSALVGDGAQTNAAPAPTVTQTVTEAPKPAPTKTVTKEVTKTKAEVPQACLKALDHADRSLALAGEGFGLAADSMGVFQEVIGIVVAGLESGSFDTAAIEEQNAKLEKLNGKMGRVTAKVEAETGPYNEAKEACRAAAE